MAAQTRDKSADLNLLFAFLALQMNLIDRDQLLQVMSVWVNNKSQSLGDILLEKGFLTKERHGMLQMLVQEHLQQNDNDPEKSLMAVNAVTMSLAAVREALGNVGDEDIEYSIARMSPAPGGDDLLQTQQLSSVTDKSLGTRFRILRPHAKGGLGQVSVARDDELNREVALKEIQPQYADNQMSRSRFVLEAEITGGLEHPGIVPVYGMGAHPDGRPYYAMRFIRGDSLKETIAQFHKANKGKRDPGQQTLEFHKLLRRFIDVCYAMHYAHSRQVLHRDIKPGNIMLGKYGETMVVDWGMAKVVNAKEEEPTLDLDHMPIVPSISKDIVATSMGSTVGTPPYMSPEQAAGRLDRLGPVSDIYGLGATLFHLLTGRPPFRDKDVGSVLNRVMAGDFEPPREVDSSVPKPLEGICLKAMSLSADQRYQTAGELAEDIEHWLADEPVTAFKELLWQKTFRWFRRHRAWAQAIAASLVLISAVSTFAAISVNGALTRETRAKVAEADAKDKARTKAAEAVRQRDFAVNRLRDARWAIDKFVTGAAVSLQYHWMYADERQRFLRMAVDEYAKLTEQQVDLPSLEIERGRTLKRLGETERMLGETAAAAEAYQNAMAIFERYPKEPDAQLEVANTYNLMGLVHADENQQVKAEQSYRSAIVQLQPIVEADPDQFAFSCALGDVFHNLGALQRQAGDLGAAASSLREAIAQYDRSRNRSLGQNEYVIALAKSRLVLGRILLKQGDYVDALEQFDFALREGETILKKSVDVEPAEGDPAQTTLLLQAEREHIDAREVVATASLERAAVLGKLGKYNEQQLAFQVAVNGYGVLSDKLRHMRPYRENLSATLYNQGWALYRLGRTNDAEMALRGASVYYDELANDFKLPKFREDKAITIDATGRMFGDQGKDDQAASIHQTAMTIFAGLVQAYPDVPRYVERQAVAQANLGHVLHKLGKEKLDPVSLEHFQAASEHFQAAIEALEQLIANQPDRPELHDSAAAIYKQLGVLHLDRDDETAAGDAFEKAKGHWQTIAKSDKDPAAEHLNRLAMFLANCPLESVRDAQAARQLATRAHKSALQNAFYCTTLGVANYRAGDWPAAVEWFHKAIALREIEPQGNELFFLAMALWQQAAGPSDDAEQSYQQALWWTDQHRPGNLDLRHVRDEAQHVREQFNTNPTETTATDGE